MPEHSWLLVLAAVFFVIGITLIHIGSRGREKARAEKLNKELDENLEYKMNHGMRFYNCDCKKCNECMH